MKVYQFQVDKINRDSSEIFGDFGLCFIFRDKRDPRRTNFYFQEGLDFCRRIRNNHFTSCWGCVKNKLPGLDADDIFRMQMSVLLKVVNRFALTGLVTGGGKEM